MARVSGYLEGFQRILLTGVCRLREPRVGYELTCPRTFEKSMQHLSSIRMYLAVDSWPRRRLTRELLS